MSAADQSPDTLFARARAGEPVVAELVAAHLDRLRAYVRCHMNPALRAEGGERDVLQSVCADLLAARDGFDFRGEAQFRAWMFTAARNKMIEKLRYRFAERRDARRELHGNSSLQEALIDPTLPTPSTAAAAAERVRLVEQAIHQLSPEHREVITLTQFVGLSTAEAAEHLGRGEDATRMLLGRALRKLAAELRRLGIEPDSSLP